MLDRKTVVCPRFFLEGGIMKSKMLIAAVLACAALPAFAIDLTPEEGTELRSRADGLIA